MGLSHWSTDGAARGVVLTVPAGGTVHLIRTYHVHACPNTAPYDYKPTQYLACRAEGGLMDRVYDLDPAKAHLFLLNPARIAIERNKMINAQPLGDAAKERASLPSPLAG